MHTVIALGEVGYIIEIASRKVECRQPWRLLILDEAVVQQRLVVALELRAVRQPDLHHQPSIAAASRLKPAGQAPDTLPQPSMARNCCERGFSAIACLRKAFPSSQQGSDRWTLSVSNMCTC